MKQNEHCILAFSLLSQMSMATWEKMWAEPLIWSRKIPLYTQVCLSSSTQDIILDMSKKHFFLNM